MTTVISPTLEVTEPAHHEHLGFNAIYGVFADKFRVRRQSVRLQLTRLEYVRMSSPRSLVNLARRLRNEFGGVIEVGKCRRISTAGKTTFYIEAEALPLEA